jgi:hypothetical protein
MDRLVPFAALRVRQSLLGVIGADLADAADAVIGVRLGRALRRY